MGEHKRSMTIQECYKVGEKGPLFNKELFIDSKVKLRGIFKMKKLSHYGY